MDSKQPFEEAKALDEILKRTAVDSNGDPDVMRFILVLSGMMMETLIEYEEPDAVMEQSFHRISELLHVTPVPDNLAKMDMPAPVRVDIETEIGREIARESAERLDEGLSAVHEIIIAICYNEFPIFEDQGYPVPETLRIMIEAVIQSLVFEMATQDFADIMIEDFITEGEPIASVLASLGTVSGHYIAQSTTADHENHMADMVKIMAAEGVRHNLPGTRVWSGLDMANDSEDIHLENGIKPYQEVFEEFFEAVDFDDPRLKAVAVAKTGGRMAALVSGPQMNLIQPSLAKMLLKTGLVKGLKIKQV